VRRPLDGFRRQALSLAVLAVSLSACQHRPVRTGAPELSVTWPPPPDAPRVAYVGAVHAPPDLGIRANWFVRFVNRVIRGRRPVAMARPYAIAVAPSGAIAVADPDARSVHLFDVARGKYRRLDRTGEAPFASPVGVAVDGRGDLYVADSGRGAVDRFDGEGRWSRTLAGADTLVRPAGLAFDRERDVLYVVDTGAHRVLKLDPDGRVIAMFGRRGAGEAEFNFPVAVALDGAGRLYVSDSMNFRVQILDEAGRFVGRFGGPGGVPGAFDKAKGIALDADGHVWVVEGLHDTVHVFDANGRLLTVVGSTGDGPGEFFLPAGIHIDTDGRVLVADSANHRIQILRYLGGPDEGGGGL